MAAAAKRQSVRQIIGRTVRAVVSRFWSGGVTVDTTRTDYIFWDKFRHGKAAGYAIVSVFAKPITEIVTGFVLGEGLKASLLTQNPDAGEDSPEAFTNSLLSRFTSRIKGRLLQVVIDLYGLGDQYIVVNQVDGTLSIPSPETVDVEYAKLDYRRMVKVTITTKLADATVTDVYTDDLRQITVKNTGGAALTLDDGTVLERGKSATLDYANLIGRIPVIHFANERTGNEINGRPIYEGLLTVFQRYDDLTEKMISGAEIAGNPIPVFEGMEDVDSTIEAHSTQDDEQYTDTAGNTINRVKIAFDRLPALFIGKGGSFKFAAPPGGFTNDIRNVLKLLFLLILDFTRIPEVVWGNELSSARASAEEQMKTFYAYITGRRMALQGEGADDVLGLSAQGGLLELLDVWLRVQQIIHGPKVLIAPCVIAWPELGEVNQEMRLKWVEFLQRIGALTRKTALAQSDIVDDVDGETDAAGEERAAEVDPFEQAVNNDLAA